MDIVIITLFPEMFAALESSIPGIARTKGHLQWHTLNPRDYAENAYGQIDDRSYGGGPGMVMQAPPLARAIAAAKAQLGQDTPVIYLSPKGRPFSQQAATALAKTEKMILLCGRYEGIDERVITTCVDREISLGDYVISGGELAAMVVIDAAVRLLPGVLGSAQSSAEDSFTNGLLDHPHYTRPEEFSGIGVPDVLLSGNHTEIAKWRLKQALGQTWLKRSDLLEKRTLSVEEADLLNEFTKEHGES